jgi:DNA-binding NarL/FixJ family response regulator
MVLRVVLAEDNYLLRAGTAALLDGVDGVELVCAAADLPELLEATDRHRPDVVMTDIRMPPTHTTEGIDAAHRIRAGLPGTAVLVLSQYADPEYAYSLLAEGASGLGYLLKERVADVGELVNALREVVRGGSVLDPKVVEAVVGRVRHNASRLDRLTRREREVLEHMAEGRNNAGIAAALVLTERAVENYINAVFHKLGLSEEQHVHRRVKAVLALLRERGEAGDAARG